MIVYDKEQKQIVIPNGLGNVNIIINQGCDDDKPTPPQDGWGMTGNFNNWGETPDIPFKENGEWEGRPYKVIRNFGATGGEFKIRRNNAWTNSYTASFHNEPQFAQLLKNDFNMSINDGVWDIYLFFGDDGEPNEMLILRPGTDLSTIQYEYTLTISTDKENAIIEIADSYRGMTDRYCGDVTVTMKYGCIYYINVYLEGYEDISDEITCYNDEERNYTLTKTKYNTIADIYGSPSYSTVTFKGLVALSFDYKSGKNILFTDHTGSIILKNCQEPLMVGDECLVTATLRRNALSYISDLSNASVEVLSSNNYVVMPTDAVELINLGNLYAPNEDGYAEMKYLYADGTVVMAPSSNLMRIETDATKPDNISLQGDFSDWVGKLVEGDNIRVYMFPENNQKYFWVTDIIKLKTCKLGSLSWTLDRPYTSRKGASDYGYDGFSEVIVSPENLIAQEKENAVNDFKKGMDEITITKNGTYSTEDQETLNSIAFNGNSYFDTGIVPTENIKIEACIKVTNGNDSGLGGIIIGGGIGRFGESTENRGIAIYMTEGEIYGIWGAIKSEKEPYRFEGTTTVVLQKTDDSWHWTGEKGPFGASTLYIGGYNRNGTRVERTFFQSIVYIKIWTNKDDDSTLITYTPKTNGNFDANGVELQRLGEGTTTFVEENVKKYPNGFKRVEVNVPDLNGSYDEGYAEGERVGYGQGKTDGINEQKGKLSQIRITENGTYAKEDGYSEVVVDVPDLNGSYDEGYNQGKIDGVNEQKSKLETINITENGTYRKEDGYNEIIVDVPGSSGNPKINLQKEGLRLGYSTFTKVPECLDFSGVTDMSYMFTECANLQTIPQIDTSNVTNMSYMFYNCSNLQTIPLINTSKVTDMTYMFGSCSNLQTIPQLNTSKANTMSAMFSLCSSLVSLPALNVQNLYMPSFDGFFGYNELPKLTDLGGFLNLKCSLTNNNNLKRLPNLTYESCINILNGLYDFTGNGETPDSSQGKLKVAQSFLDKVGDEISIGVAKGWVISA